MLSQMRQELLSQKRNNTAAADKRRFFFMKMTEKPSYFCNKYKNYKKLNIFIKKVFTKSAF
jgi:hypothetical protein